MIAVEIVASPAPNGDRASDSMRLVSRVKRAGNSFPFAAFVSALDAARATESDGRTRSGGARDDPAAMEVAAVEAGPGGREASKKERRRPVVRTSVMVVDADSE